MLVQLSVTCIVFVQLSLTCTCSVSVAICYLCSASAVICYMGRVSAVLFLVVNSLVLYVDFFLIAPVSPMYSNFCLSLLSLQK